MKKIKNNNPCPCGSGLDYKKCCMIKKETESFTRLMIQRKTDELLPDLTQYAATLYEDEDLLMNAWEDFIIFDEDIERSPYQEVFHRWFLFFWMPDDETALDTEHSYPSENTIAYRYLDKNRKKLDSLTIRLLESALADPVSLWQITGIEPGKGVFLKDMLLNRERFVHDITASEDAEIWDILLANMQVLDGVYVFNLTSPYKMTADLFAEHEDHVKEITEDIDTEIDLFDYDLDLIWFFQEAMNDMLLDSELDFDDLNEFDPVAFMNNNLPEEDSGDSDKPDENQITEQMDSMYLEWMDEPIYSLQGITPRELVKKKDGKKIAAEIIAGWEKNEKSMENLSFRFDFNKLRKALGIDCKTE